MPAVAGILVTHGDRVLMERRSPNDSFYPDGWIFPGGKLEKGESFEDALIRELKEELGIDIEWVYLRPVKHKPIYYGGHEGDARYEVRAIYVMQWEGIVPDKILDSGNELTWHRLGAALQSSIPPVKTMARAFVWPDRE